MLTAFYSEISDSASKSINLESFKISHLPSNESLNKITQLLALIQENPIDSKEELFHEFFPKEHDAFNNSNNFLKELKRVEVAFGEQTFHQIYYDKTNEFQKIDTLATDNLEQFLGYNALIPEGNNQPKKEKASEDPFEQNFAQEEEKDQFANLQIYWRFDEGKGMNLNDLSDLEINGIMECEGEHDNDEIWNMLDDGDPLELEDKWGKKCPTQYGIDLNIVNIKNIKKNWFESIELKQFTLEFWLKPRVKNGLILEISNDNFACLLHDGLLKILIKGKPLGLMEDEGLKEENNNDEDFQQVSGYNKNNEDNKRIKENFWNHLAIVYDNSQPKTLIIYLNCFEIGYSNIILENELFKEKIINIGKGKFNGEITEFRLWKSANSLTEIKDSYRTPLEIVAEKKKKIKMKFKDKDKDKPQEGDVKADLKKFTAFLTMAPGTAKETKEIKEEKKTQIIKPPSIENKKSVIEEKPHDEDVQSFATYTFNVKPSQNQFYNENEKNQDENMFKKKPSFVGEGEKEKEENKWGDFASTKPSEKNNNNPAEFGGFGEFASTTTKTFETNKNDWQNFEFGSTSNATANNSAFSKKEKDDNEFFNQRKASTPVIENVAMSDRNRTASLFEKYDQPFNKAPDSTNEQPFGNPFLKKPSENNMSNSYKFPPGNEKNNTQTKVLNEKPQLEILASNYDYEKVMQEVNIQMEKSRAFMKEVI